MAALEHQRPNVYSLIEALFGDDATVEPEALGQVREEVENILAALPKRDATVLRMRYSTTYGQRQTLQQIGDFFGLTRERIRQIEKRALRRARHPRACQNLRALLIEQSTRQGPRPQSEQPGNSPLARPQPGARDAWPEKLRRTYSRAYEPWSLGEEAFLTKAFAAGRRIAEIAADLGRQPSAIETRLKRLGLLDT